MKTRLLWALSALFILYATTLPFEFDPSIANAEARLWHVSLHPLQGPDGRQPSFPDMLQNVLLFMPFGALGFLSVRQRKDQSQAPSDVGAAALATLAGFILASFVEGLQLLTVDRVSSLNDVLTDSIGALVGAIAMLGSASLAPKLSERVALMPQASQAPFRMVTVAMVVLGIAAWHPFDVSLDVGAFVAKLRAFVTHPWQVGAWGDEGVDLLRYALLGGAATVWLRESGLRRPRVAAAVVASSMAILLELSQLFIGARMPSLKDMLIGVVGGGAGALIGPYASAIAPPVMSVVLVALAWLAAAVMELTPFAFSPERNQIGWMPFLAYYQYTSGQTVSHVLELVLAFFPIGFVLSRTSDGVPRWPRIVGVALVLAALLEYLQGWIVGRYPDITDVMVLTLGAAIGAWAASAVPSGEAGEDRVLTPTLVP